MDKVRFVIVESPFAPKGKTSVERKVSLARNLAYVRAAMADCFARGEVPYASHALYTQPGVLDDTIPEERAKGIQAGFSIAKALAMAAELLPWFFECRRIFYVERGWSSGMHAACDDSAQRKWDIKTRHLREDGFWNIESDNQWCVDQDGTLTPISKVSSHA
jgi:hypothetical protein